MSIENEILAKGLTAPRITQADVEAAIVGETYFTAADGVLGAYRNHNDVFQGTDPHNPGYGLITVCVLIMRNGHRVVGVNEGPVSADNFDAELGRKLARQKAADQIWPLLGYELRTKLADHVAEPFVGDGGQPTPPPPPPPKER